MELFRVLIGDFVRPILFLFIEIGFSATLMLA